MAIVRIPVQKGGLDAKGQPYTVEIDTQAVLANDEAYSAVIMAGLEAILNRTIATSKVVGAITKKTGAELEAAHQAARDIFAKNLEALTAGNAKPTKGKKLKLTKEERQVRTEALRIAKNVVKDMLRANNVSPARVEAKEITAYATELVDTDASYMAQARENLSKRSEIKVDFSKITLATPTESDRLIKKAEAEKEARKGQLSKTQASKPAKHGVVPPRTKPKAPVTDVLASMGNRPAGQHLPN